MYTSISNNLPLTCKSLLLYVDFETSLWFANKSYYISPPYQWAFYFTKVSSMGLLYAIYGKLVST